MKNPSMNAFLEKKSLKVDKDNEHSTFYFPTKISLLGVNRHI